MRSCGDILPFSEQSGQLRQQARAPDMSGKVKTTEKKACNTMSGKYGTGLHLLIIDAPS